MRALLLAALLVLQPQTARKPNRLVHEKSPYLLQHAYNPVDWHPWGEAAFEKARRENRIIFLSVGYSTCYWCHVMEREVFENTELAALMNRYFVSIKVDREERPDVDRIYMAALFALAGGGGWPMSLFLTPERRPIYGASYMPPAEFRDVAEKIQAAWKKEPAKILESGRQLTDQLKQQAAAAPGGGRLEAAVLQKGFEQFRSAYDPRHAGFGTHLKFPRPAGLNFLLRYHRRFGEPAALEMTLATLRAMARGGIRDHLGGGFHRYSTDRAWRVPHFEKMLYDQAQLAPAYLEAYQITRDDSFAAVARETLDYVLRHLTDPAGGFYSAEDAESAPDPAKPQQKEEGAFYLWTRGEIERVLGKQRGEAFAAAYGAGEKPGNLFAAGSTDGLAEARTVLLAARDKRPRPYRDDKILVSWNGLTISALARAHQVLGDPQYLAAAQRAARFILAKLYDPKARRLLRRYRDGEARHDAQLDDYAFLTMGLLDLYEADFDIAWLQRAMELTERQIELFSDPAGGFFDTSGADSTLLYRTKESYDGAEPCGNSIAAWNLLRLAQMTGQARWRDHAARTLQAFAGRLAADPESLPQLLVALDYQLAKPKQIILAGRRGSPDLAAMLRQVHRRYLPAKILLLADGAEGQRFLARSLPSIASMTMRGGKATAYVCENYACKLPTSDVQAMAKLLD